MFLYQTSMFEHDLWDQTFMKKYIVKHFILIIKTAAPVVWTLNSAALQC